MFGGCVQNNPELENIIKSSCELFNETETIDNLKSLTCDYRLYTWWSDIPLYKRSHLQDFFSKINFDNINWYHFDHLIYSYYLVLYDNFIFDNLDNIGIHWSLESFSTHDVQLLIKLKQKKYSFSWATMNLYKKYKKILIHEECFLLYHIDRYS